MKKKTFIIMFFVLVQLPVFAQKIPVKIAPAQVISTHHDEVETGDKISYEIVNDVYVNDKLYLKKNTPIVGTVDYIHPNGWCGDSAQISFKNFKTIDAENKPVNISYPLLIDGNKEIANDSRYVAGFVLTYLIRGAEIFVEPDTRTYNIFIEK